MEFNVNSIGKININEDGMSVQLEEKYIPALQGIDGFSHLQVLWYFDGRDTPAARTNYVETKPYKAGPEKIGVFATRSPARPNPLALTCVQVTYIDHANGVIGLAYIDADPGSPVLDIKPYTPSLDRVESPAVPNWCAHWPRCCETAGDFAWEKEFNF